MKTVYTLAPVSRPTTDGWAFLVIRVEWDQKADIFRVSLPGEFTREWPRRGLPLFSTWDEGNTYVRSHGWPLG